MRDWRKHRVVVVGAARQGLALARYLLAHGAQVIINDQRPLEDLEAARQSFPLEPAWEGSLSWICGGHPNSLLDQATLLCPSGGVPLTLPLVEEAVRRGIPLSNDSQIFLEAVPCKVIGITGSAGKTTTTTLVGRIALSAVSQQEWNVPYRKVWVGGNIGSPLIAEVDRMGSNDLAIIELSSFQLEIMTCSPKVAAILNLTPNHLDRHGTMQAYKEAKARILNFQSQQDIAVLGSDDPGAWELAAQVRGRLFSFGLTQFPEGMPGATLQKDRICLMNIPGFSPVTPVINRQEISLRGEHNLLNVMAACAISAAAGLPSEAMREGVRGFAGVSHRLEFVRSWGGADWYNDSIATAPERSIAAIHSFQEPLVLLAGGRDKKLPWDEFARLVRQRVDHLIIFGEAADTILKTFNKSDRDTITITRCEGLHEAVLSAAELVEPGDIVLLSPGGTSFDEFKDFEERGECFARWVRELP